MPPNEQGRRRPKRAKLRMDLVNLRNHRQLNNTAQPAAGYGDLEVTKEWSGPEGKREDTTLFQQE